MENKKEQSKVNEIGNTQEPKYLDIYMELKKQNPKIEQKKLDEESKKIYEFEKQEFDKYVSTVNGNSYFSVSSFLDSVGEFKTMITSANRIVNKESVMDYVQFAPHKKNELMITSYKLYNYIQEYKNLIRYYSDMLYYRPVVNPYDSISKIDFINGLKFIEGYNYKTKLGEITTKLLLQDIYFGYEITNRGETKKILKEMPYKYCDIVATDKYGVKLYQFDLDYFNQYPNELSSFPKEFGIAYNKFNKHKGDRYFIPNVKKQFAIKFDTGVEYSLPFFTGIFIDMIRLQEIKTVATESSKSENYKLLWQKIPMDNKSGKKDQYLIGSGVTDYHSNLVNNSPNGVGTVTTPMDVGVISLADTSTSSRDIVDRHFSNLMSASGTSKLVFNSSSTGSTGVSSSIKMDEATMFKVLRKYEDFFNRQYNYRDGKNVLTVSFLNVSIHNEDEVYNRFLKLAQYGYNKFYPAVASGMSQLDVLYGGELESVLGLHGILGKPLVSSHTQNGDEGDDNSNTKSEGDLTDEGAKTRDKQ